MKNLVFLFIVTILWLLQVTFFDWVKVLNVKPDLLLICMFISSIIFDLPWVYFLGIFVGILKDTMATFFFGINTLLFSLWIFLIVKLSKKISLENNCICSVFVFFLAILNASLLRLIFFSFDQSIPSIGIFLRIAFLESLFTALIFSLVFRIIKPLLEFS